MLYLEKEMLLCNKWRGKEHNDKEEEETRAYKTTDNVRLREEEREKGLWINREGFSYQKNILLWPQTLKIQNLDLKLKF